IPRTPNSPKYARSFRTCAELKLKRSASSCEDTVLTPSSSSCCRQRVYTDRRRTVISGIFGILNGERGVMRGPSRGRFSLPVEQGVPPIEPGSAGPDERDGP